MKSQYYFRKLMSNRFSPRLKIAMLISGIAGSISRLLGIGAGVALSGRILTRIYPNCLGELSTGIESILVSATNGKTTTTALCAAALSVDGNVATNDLGNNMTGGIAVSLAGNSSAKRAVLEVDEAHLEEVARGVQPSTIILMNLSRDQLDRVSEVRMVAKRWSKAIEAVNDALIIANISDPLVHYATLGAERIVRIALGNSWNLDAVGCPVCDSALSFRPNGDFDCSNCKFSSPEPDYVLSGGSLVLPDGSSVTVEVALPGDFNILNAAIAICLANELGIPIDKAKLAIANVRSVAGRYQAIEVADTNVTLLMAKNPAGWAAILDTLDFGDKAVVLGLNAEIADGKDTSWIYDVDFSRLRSQTVISTGRRAFDLSVRLGYAGVEHKVILDQRKAVEQCGVSAAVYVGNYTAFQQLRRDLS